jgi:hypothetical protein
MIQAQKDRGKTVQEIEGMCMYTDKYKLSRGAERQNTYKSEKKKKKKKNHQILLAWLRKDPKALKAPALRMC